MTEQKTRVIYGPKDPFQAGVNYIAIETETRPPFVFATYFDRNRSGLPAALPDSMLMISASQARRLFDLQPGSLDEVVRAPK